MILNNTKKILKKNTKSTLILSLIIVPMVIGSCATGYQLSLQGHTISTSTGLRSMWDPQILDRQIDYSFIFGRPVNWIIDPMECVTSRIDGLASPLWRVQKWSTLQPLQRIQGLAFYQRQELMLKRCLQTRWYPYPRIIRSFSNRYRTVWNAPRRNYPTRSRREGLREIPLEPQEPRRIHQPDWIQRSTGRIPATTPTMGRNYNSSSMMNRVNGRGRTTSSITGESQRRVSVSGRR